MTRQIYFKCLTECSSICCNGATILTIREIGQLYKFFPITIGFRKIHPIDLFHESYIQDIAFKYRNFYIIGDFIAGNRLKKRCRLLKNSLCSIHGSLKPLQCRVVPFSITFPEEYQDRVIKEKRKGAFRNCKGFDETFTITWDFNFKETELKTNFYRLKEELSFQKDLMEKIFDSLYKTPFFSKFIVSQDGLLEVPITEKFIEEICLKTSIKKVEEFLKTQKTLFVKELTTENCKNSLFAEALNVIEKMKI